MSSKIRKSSSYKLFMGYGATGLGIWNKAKVIRSGEYEPIAHISFNKRILTWRKSIKLLPISVIKKVYKEALNMKTYAQIHQKKRR